MSKYAFILSLKQKQKRMQLSQTIQHCLQWLFKKYLENPNTTWNIFECNNENNYDDIPDAAKIMADKGFIKNIVLNEGGFFCSITTLGILQVSNELSEVKYKILEGSIEDKKLSLMEILKADAYHFRRVQDYALYLKQIGIIECIFHENDVLAKPTFFGKEWYEANKTRCLN